MIKIDREKSGILPESQQVADVIVGLVSPFVIPQGSNGHRAKFIPRNITLKEITRRIGEIGINEVERALRREVLHPSGAVGYRKGLVFIDTEGNTWEILSGPTGSKRPKQAARVAGKKPYGAEDRIRDSLERHSARENTRVVVRRSRDGT